MAKKNILLHLHATLAVLFLSRSYEISCLSQNKRKSETDGVSYLQVVTEFKATPLVSHNPPHLCNHALH